MKGAARRAFLIWLLAMLAGAVIVWNSRFVADMSFFLPAHPSAGQQALVDQIKTGAVSRLLMLAIAGGDARQRARLSRDLRARLAALPEFVSVDNGEAGSRDADRDFLMLHRYLLSPAVRPERFTVDGLRDAIANSVDLLASPAGLMLKPLLVRDPTGELVALIGSLNAGSQPATREGVWASRDGERAMLLVQTRALGSDTDGQEEAIGKIRLQFAAVSAAAGIQDARLQLSGPGLFAVNARATIKGEVTRLSLISTIAIVGVLLFVYRSLPLLLLGLLPVVSGALAGIVAVSLVHGTVFGITVGFGSALIGEAVDYSIYYLVQSGRIGVAAWRQRLWPTIRLGVLTSVCGFGALLFSGFPGLAQLGLYSLSGVLTAALVTRFVLPHLTGNALQTRDLAGLGRAAARGIHALRGGRWPVLFLAALAVAHLFAHRDALWHSSISALSTVSAEEAALDLALRADIAAPDSRHLVVVSAGDREGALQAAETAGEQLDRLVAAGVIGSYDSPARFLPSRATQKARCASLPEGADLRARLAAAQAGSPLAATRLGGFVDDVASAREQCTLTRESLTGTSLALVVDALLLQRPDGWTALLPLHPPSGDRGPEIASAPVRDTLTGSNVLFIDMKGEFDQLYSDYLHEAMLLSLAGLAAIVALLGITLRSLKRLAAVMLPLVLAVLMVSAGLSAIGERLHLMHLIGMLLIVAVGSNYALFFDHAKVQRELDPETLASMLVANLTTAIGFGTLALSKVPVLHAVGVTVGPGAILTLLLAAILVPRPVPQ
ncbi:MAG: MMPL family transporter [Dechloromonas sp.]|nr:MMPL family transporter [Dechloromonas sp.]